MQKYIVSMFLVSLLCVFNANAASETITVTDAVNSTNYSAAFTASGYLEKIEVTGITAAGTCTVMVATMNGTAVVDLIASNTLSASKVFIPRRVGTDTAGTALASAVTTLSGDTNIVTQILVAPYERYMLGGNVKVRSVNTGTTAQTYNVTLFYEPTLK
jgi:hypothetical protein